MELAKTRRKTRCPAPPLPLVAGDPTAVVGFAIGFLGLAVLFAAKILAG